MLMRFSVSNFMSFGYQKDAEGNVTANEYYLYAGRSEQHSERVIRFHDRKVLKFSAVYGANASGKTNLLHAISAGRNIVLYTMEGPDYTETYCKNKAENKKNPTLFEYEFTIGDECYAYGFTVSLSEKKILSEWLYKMNGASERPIFERTTEDDQYYFDEDMFSDDENKQQFLFFIKDVNRLKSSLLIYEMARRELAEEDYRVFLEVFDWFRKQLIIIYPETKIGKSYHLFGSDNDNLVKILDYLDTGITDYTMRSINESAFKEYFSNEKLADRILRDFRADEHTKEILSYGNTLFEIGKRGKELEISKLMFQHGEDENKYEYGEESDGTKRLIELMAVILNDEEDRVFIIDELDRSLHPQMTIKFVETFLKMSKKKNTQLLITTHESNLMDLNILRRDEIWFAEKEKDNTTTLYTLEKFKIRYDKKASKNYLAGRYGAVPVFKDFEYVWGEEMN